MGYVIVCAVNISEKISINSCHAASIEEYAESFKSFDAKIVQLSKGSFDAIATNIDLGAVSIIRANSAPKYQAIGWFHDDFTFCFPLDGRSYYTSRGLMERHSQPVSSGNCDFHVIYPDRFDHIVVTIKKAKLLKYLSEAQIETFEESVVFAHKKYCMHDSSEMAINFICNIYSALCLSKFDGELAELSATHYSRLVIHFLFDYLSGTNQHRVEINSNYARILNRGFEVIDKSGGESLGLNDLSQRIYSSKRSIQYAFSKFIGMSPMEFVRTNRLNRIREDLLSANIEESKVSDVLSKYRVSNQARFSKDYHDFFHELPRQTLAQT